MPQVNLYGNGLVSSGGETRLSDGLGAVRQSTNGSQSVVWSGTSQAYGVPLAANGSTVNHYQWGAQSGYRTDGFGPTYASPLLKVGARYYDPEFGCFMTRDTELSQSPYVYCDGDPVNNSDPSGHLSKKDYLAALGAAAGFLIAMWVVVLIGPELAVGVGVYEGIGFILGADGIATGVGGATGSGLGGLLGAKIGEGMDEDAARPKKGIGYQGDKVTSAGMNQDYSNSGGHWHKEGGPYSGAPNYPLGPVPK